MQNRTQSNLQKINDLWSIHDYSYRMMGHGCDDRPLPSGTHCLAFAIGKRFLEMEGLQFRLGVSFGDNPFTPEMATGFVPPPVQPGRFVFGVHLIATKGDKLTLYDQWSDSFNAGECDTVEQALVRAQHYLEAMPDEKYLQKVREGPDTKGPLRTSSAFLLQDFEVVQGEAF